MVQFCKFLNVKIVDPSNPNINFIVFHHRYETLEQGCFRVADLYRYQNSSKIKFLIDYDGTIQLDKKGNKILI
jgi:hypothetical protein